jgi:hypothetical protein
LRLAGDVAYLTDFVEYPAIGFHRPVVVERRWFVIPKHIDINALGRIKNTPGEWWRTSGDISVVEVQWVEMDVLVARVFRWLIPRYHLYIRGLICDSLPSHFRVGSVVS